MKNNAFRKALALVILATLLVPVFSVGLIAAAAAENPAWDDYLGAPGLVCGVTVGDYWGEFVEENYGAEVVWYSTLAELMDELTHGKVDYAFFGEDVISGLDDSGLYGDVSYLPVPQDVIRCDTAAAIPDAELRAAYNEWLAESKASGLIDEVMSFYKGEKLPGSEDVPEIELAGENGTLVMADSGNYPPWTYPGTDGEFIGINTEIAQRFCQYMGMDLQLEIMSYDGILPAIASGRADMSACLFTITEDRQEGIEFANPMNTVYGVVAIHQPGGASAPAANTAAAGVTWEQFIGKTAGVSAGSVYDALAQENFDPENILYYTDYASALEDLKNGRSDFVLRGHTSALLNVKDEAYADLACIPLPKEMLSLPLGGISASQDMIDKFNTFLKEIQSDGTYDEIIAAWLAEDFDMNAPPEIPDLGVTGAGGVLRCAGFSELPPYCFLGPDLKATGLDIDLVTRFAASMDMTVEFTDMSFTGLIPYVNAGKADIALSGIFITPERQKEILFTDPYVSEVGAILYRKADFASSAPETSGQRDYTDFIGKRAALLVGLAEDMVSVAKIDLQAAEVLEFADLASCYEAARQQKVDYMVTDLSQARVFVANPDNQDLEAIEIPPEVFSLPMGTYSQSKELIDAFNAFLKEIEADGTMADIYARWFEAAPGTDTPMPEIPTTGENGVLTVATSFISAPFVYLGADSEAKGYEIELMQRFAASTGRTVEFVDMDFSALIPYVQSGRADFGMCATSITAERQKQVIFSDPTYTDQLALVTLKQETTEDTTGFLEWISTAVEKNLIADNRWKLIVRGLGVTAVLAICSQLFGTALGAGLAYLQTRRNPVARHAVGFIQWLVTGLPMMTILLIFYYILFRSAQISNVITGVAAYTLTQGISIGQHLVAAMSTVDPIEIEAARAMGFSAAGAFRTVTLPQAVRFMLPGYMTGFVELVKATAIVGYIAIQDLSRASDIIRSRTFDPYFPILFAAVIYLLLTTLFVQLFKLLIKKLNERGRAE
jgi:polar amino acid transport system substrate-binding protein